MKMELKHLQTFEQHTDKNLNISDVSESKLDKNIEKNIVNYLLTLFDNKFKKKIKEIVKSWLQNSENWKKAYYLTGDERKTQVLDVLENKVKSWGKQSIFKDDFYSH